MIFQYINRFVWYNYHIANANERRVLLAPAPVLTIRKGDFQMATSDSTTKRCSECDIEYPATLEYFHSDKRIFCGLKAACKQCSNKRLQQFRVDHPEKIKEYTQNYAIPRRDLLSQRSQRWVKANPEKKRLQNKRYVESHPDHTKAHAAVKYAVKTGKLPSPKILSCSCQGEGCKGQASEYHHHKGYAPEFWLDVIPVCSKCHKQLNGGK